MAEVGYVKLQVGMQVPVPWIGTYGLSDNMSYCLRRFLFIHKRFVKDEPHWLVHRASMKHDEVLR